MRNRILIIFNPSAGRPRRALRRLRTLIQLLERRGCAVELRAAMRLGDAERLTRKAEPDFDVIVAAGGDGTINAVANGLAEKPRPLALLPLGTANVLAREIGVPRRIEALAAAIAGGPTRPVWPGRVGDRLFLMMAGSGFDAEVVAAVNPVFKRRFGKLAFAWAIFRQLIRYRGRELSVRIDDVEHHASSVIATKGRLYAGSHLLAPAANLADPALYIVLFSGSGRLWALGYLGALMLGLLPQLKSVRFVKATSAVISSSGAVPVHADGELIGQLPAIVSVASLPLNLVSPSNATR